MRKKRNAAKKAGSGPGRAGPAETRAVRRKAPTAVEIRKKFLDEINRLLESGKARLASADLKRILIGAIPYIIIFYIIEKEAWLYRHCTGNSMIQKLMNLFLYFSLAFRDPLPSFNPRDICIGIAGTAGFWLFVWYRKKNAKKFRQGEEYGSARWGAYYQL